MAVIGIILKILLAILLLIAAALAVPTRVYFRYADDIFLQIRYLFLKINVPLTEEQKASASKKKKIKKTIKPKKNKIPDKKNEQKNSYSSDSTVKSAKSDNKKEKKLKNKNKKAKKPNPVVKWLKGLYKKGGADAIIEAFKKIASLAGNVLKPIFKNLRIRRLDINIISASEDAAEAAINYGKLCAGVYPALTVLLNIMKYDDYSVSIKPDFDKKAFEADISVEISLVPWVVIAGAVHAAIRFVKFKIKGEL